MNQYIFLFIEMKLAQNYPASVVAKFSEPLLEII